MASERNTVYQLEVWDALAVHQSLQFSGLGLNTLAEFNLTENRLEIFVDHYVMDPQGYGLGTFTSVFYFPLYPRRDFCIGGLPYNLSEYMVFPDTLELLENGYPESEEPPNDYDPERDEYMWYIKPDDSEVWDIHGEQILYEIEENLMDAVFDAQARTWTIGDVVWKIGDGPIDLNNL